MGNRSLPGKMANLYVLTVTERRIQEGAKYATKDLNLELKGILPVV